MKKLFQSPIFLAILSGVLLSIAWPPMPFSGLIFISLIPLLHLATIFEKKLSKLFLFAFIAFLIRYIITLYWIAPISFVGFLLLIILLSSLFAFIVIGYGFLISKSRHRVFPLLFFVSAWVCLEWLCERVLDFPWANLGFCLSSKVSLIQWYEYSGIYGGTAWILGINVLIAESLRSFYQSTTRYRWLLSISCFVFAIVPAIYSSTKFDTYREINSASHFFVVQSNWNVHANFTDSSGTQLLAALIKLSKPAPKNTIYFIWPEGAIEPWHALNEDNLSENKSIIKIQDFLQSYPNGNLISGLITYRINLNQSHDTSWYNSAISIDNSERIQIYHKQKLIPGAETGLIPRFSGKPGYLYFFTNGQIRAFSRSTKSDIFYAESGLGLAPVICFESAFNSYVSNTLVLQGAQFIALMSNDGWLANTSGIWQHLEYARILAIENRRSLASASNEGISCMIDQKGQFIAEAEQNKWMILQGDLNAREDSSFYSSHGDIIVLISFSILLLSLLILIFKKAV